MYIYLLNFVEYGHIFPNLKFSNKEEKGLMRIGAVISVQIVNK